MRQDNSLVGCAPPRTRRTTKMISANARQLRAQNQDHRRRLAAEDAPKLLRAQDQDHRRRLKELCEAGVPRDAPELQASACQHTHTHTHGDYDTSQMCDHTLGVALLFLCWVEANIWIHTFCCLFFMDHSLKLLEPTDNYTERKG